MFSKLKHTTVSPFDNRDDGFAYAKYDLKIVVPERWSKLGLCHIGSVVSSLGLMAVIYEDKYYVLKIPLQLRMEPELTSTVSYGKLDYYVFEISKGLKCFNRKLVRVADAVKPIVGETIINGNVPWYCDMDILSEFFSNFSFYAGSNIADDDVIWDLFISIVARSNSDASKVYRQVSHMGGKIQWIGLKNVSTSRTDGFNKLVGTRLKDGVTSASNLGKDTPTEIEKLLT